MVSSLGCNNLTYERIHLKEAPVARAIELKNQRTAKAMGWELMCT
jgi:hypothetical protein